MRLLSRQLDLNFPIGRGLRKIGAKTSIFYIKSQKIAWQLRIADFAVA